MKYLFRQKYIFIYKNKFLDLSKNIFSFIMNTMKLLFTLIIVIFSFAPGQAQNFEIKGTVTHNAQAIPFANIYLKHTDMGTSSNEDGYYEISVPKSGNY